MCAYPKTNIIKTIYKSLQPNPNLLKKLLFP